jgi:CBS domain-containing protein
MNRFIGMIDVRSIKGVGPEKWSYTKIGGYLSDPTTYCVLDPDTEATEALRMLLARNCSRAPIVSNGVLVGLLTRKDLFKLISLNPTSTLSRV